MTSVFFVTWATDVVIFVPPAPPTTILTCLLCLSKMIVHNIVTHNIVTHVHNIVTHTNYTFFVPGLIRLFLPGPLISSGSMKSFIWSLNIMPVERDITPEPKLWEYSDNKTEKNSRAAILLNRHQNIVIKMHVRLNTCF